MSDETHNTPAMGSNQANRALRRRARAMVDKLDEIAELQDEVKALKADAKTDGYNMKAFNAIVREMRKDAEYRVAQHELEAVLKTYRQAAELPTTLEEAHKAATEAAGQAPDVDAKRAARQKRATGETEH